MMLFLYKNLIQHEKKKSCGKHSGADKFLMHMVNIMPEGVLFWLRGM